MTLSVMERSRRTAAFAADLHVGRGPPRSGATPHQILFRQGPCQLRFFPAATPRYAPMFVSLPLINTWTVWDLLPGRSVIEALTRGGVPVYALDWGSPGPEHADRPLRWFVDELLTRMIDRARRHAGQDLDAVGYCVGGTFLAMHLARRIGPVRRAAFVATPIDFHRSGRLARWADPAHFPLDVLIDARGNLPATQMRASFAWLRPTTQTTKWVTLWERIEHPNFCETWAALERWSAEAVDFPGEAYREYVRRCYFENALMTGPFLLDGRPVDLSRAPIPALVLAADRDHIAPPEACAGLAQVWGGPVATETLRGGHVGVSVASALPERLLSWARS